MANLEEFSKELKEVVRAKRLSASKIQRLTELCMKNIEHDTQLVSILYRAHKSLPTGNKVFSLYAFDALARAARSQVIKQHVTVDPASTKGNCATFLSKVEGVLDGLIEDMLSPGVPELREKTKKILDIWTNANTFPKATLANLNARVKQEIEKAASESTPQSMTPPSVPPSVTAITSQATSTSASAIPGAANLPPAILAILESAVAQRAIASSGSRNAGAPLNQATPLALLQQLTGQSAPIVNNVAPSAPPSDTSKPVPIYGPNLPPPPDQIVAQRGAVPSDIANHESGRDPRLPRWNTDAASPPRTDRWDDGRDDFYRGEGYRGRGRGRARGRGRGMSDRGGWDRGPRERSPPPYSRRDRSRSPPHSSAGSRDRYDNYPPNGRGYAPRRGSPRHFDNNGIHPSGVNQPSGSLDEFGREVRAGGSSQDVAPGTSQSSLHGTAQPNPVTSDLPKAGGLDTFNWLQFDFGSPASWDALGQAFQVTNGRLPSQEESMMLVMTAQMAGSAMMAPGGGAGPGTTTAESVPPMGSPPQPVPVWGGDDTSSPYYNPDTSTRGGGRGRGRGRGRGGYGGGYGGGQAEHNGQFGEEALGQTDSVVLGGATAEAAEPRTVEEDGERKGGMVRVGDGWEWRPAT